MSIKDHLGKNGDITLNAARKTVCPHHKKWLHQKKLPHHKSDTNTMSIKQTLLKLQPSCHCRVPITIAFKSK